MAQERLQFRVPEDESSILEEYAEENDVSKSEVLRRGMRLYLAEQGCEVPVADGLGRARDERLEKRLDEMSAELETELKAELEALEQERRSTNRTTQRLTVGSIAAGLVYLAGVSVLELGSTVVILLGIVLIGLLVGSLYLFQTGAEA